MEQVDLLCGIEESDIPFETQLFKDPQNRELWVEYIDHKQRQLIEAADSFKSKEALLCLLYRKSQAFPEDYEVWCQFVDYYSRVVRLSNEMDKDKLQAEINKINEFFLVYIESFKEKVEFWIKYLKFLVSFKGFLESGFILDVFNMALMRLKFNEHSRLWKWLFLDETIKDLEISNDTVFDIYSSFFIYLKNCDRFGIGEDAEEEQDQRLPDFDILFSELVGSVSDAKHILKFHSIFEELVEPRFLLKMSDSELELHRRYFDKLIDLSKNNKKDETLKEQVNKLFESIGQKFSDQQSIFTIRYAKYLSIIGNFDESVKILENKLKSSLTIKDFALIFDSLTEVLEKKVTELSEQHDDDVHDDNLERYLEKFEFLISNRLLLLNDVKLRQNINSPSTWIERLEILKDDEKKEENDVTNKLLVCYSKAVIEINPKKIPTDEKLLLSKIWCDYAKVYFQNGDIQTARELFETATKVPWTELEQLEYIWIEWIKLEIESNTIKHATLVCSKAISIPEQILSGKINIEDENVTIHMRLFKSIRLWSLYLDLVENTESFDIICNKYEEAMDLKIINGVMIINYCLFLEENGYLEKSFNIFERGLNIFSGESKSILYCIYLNKMLKYWDKLEWDNERVREIFEEGLDYYYSENGNNYNENLKQIYILYSEWEIKYGSKVRSLKILKEGIKNMKKQSDKLLMYKILIVNTIESRGVEWAVEVFKDAVDNLSVQIPGYISEIIDGFVKVEVSIGEIDRARQVLKYAVENIMQFNKVSTTRMEAWNLFKEFELENGDETTYKEMLRLKRYLENVYGTGIDIETTPKVESNLKDGIGFVVSSTGPKTTTFTMGNNDSNSLVPDSVNTNNNKDAITLEMDMDMDMDME